MARILLIDDEDMVRAMLRQMLERSGYDVMDAPNGRVGVRLYRAAPADIVITDIFMDDQEGLETITELRHDFPNVKIIAISGGNRLDNFDGLSIARKLGAQRTFTKPFNRDVILEAIRELLETSAAAE